MTTSQPRFTYKPALDGLRAVAVAAVIAYHLSSYRPGGGQLHGIWAKGGFLGVDMFFVLSGYLITSLLVSEWSATGTIVRSAFWIRRARRLLPALMIVLLAVAVYGALTVPADQLGRLRGDGLATLFYVQNWRLVLSGQSYFDLFNAASPLRHAWSLAIEEQFYILWPLVVILCLKLARGGRRYLAAFCVVGTVASVLLMAAVYRAGDPSRAYYGTDTRAHLLLVGAILALVLERWQPRRSVTTGAVHVGGLLLGLVCLAAFVRVGDRDSFMYRGGFLMFAVAITVVIASAVLPGRSPVRAVLSLAPLRWIGQISYGLYLWHWPVIVAMTPRRTGLDGGALDLARVGTTLVISIVSYYVVELPIRRGVVLRGRVARVVTPAAALVTAIAILVATAGAVRPSTIFAAPAGATPPNIAVQKPSVAPSTAAPAPPGESTTSAPPVRTLGIVGDSVADSLALGIQQIVGPEGISVARAAVDGCPVANGFTLTLDGAPFAWSENCTKVVPELQRKLVAEQHPDVVVWLSTWETADRRVGGVRVRFGTPEGDTTLLQAMDDAHRALTIEGARLVILTSPPRTANDYGPAPKDGADQIAHLDDLIRRFGRDHADTRVIDFSAIVCPGGYPCPEEVGGLRLRPDGAHFSPEGAVWVARRLVPELLSES